MKEIIVLQHAKLKIAYKRKIVTKNYFYLLDNQTKCAKTPVPIIRRPNKTPPAPSDAPENRSRKPNTIRIEAGLLAII